MKIILIGMPASGKSTVAKILGERLNLPVVDTDGEIEKSHGKISEIFKKYGEEYFRTLETETIARVCGINSAVISTGGGCVLRKENIRLLKSQTDGTTVYLRAGLEELIKRAESIVTGGNNTRPLLKGDVRKKMQTLLTERENLYSAAADLTVYTDGLTAEKVANKITEYLK